MERLPSQTAQIEVMNDLTVELSGKTLMQLYMARGGRDGSPSRPSTFVCESPFGSVVMRHKSLRKSVGKFDPEDPL
jgi:hypothetical protein